MPLVPTADLCDANEAALDDGSLRVLRPGLRSFGGVAAFAGPAATVRAIEDNALVRAALEEPGQGRVLVVDGAGSTRCALVGGNLGGLAVENGWAGVVVWGCVRDTAELAACATGVYALAAHPRKSRKGTGGARDVALLLDGTPVRPGEWIYADGDGVLVSARRLGGG